MSWLWKGLAALSAAAMAVLSVMLRLSNTRAKRAQAEADRYQREAAAAAQHMADRQRAEQADQTAAEQGHVAVQEARDRAHSGRRDHFSRGLRDD